ncbi:MAG: hypothetical protein KatS3mg032_1962 [Cyclobacteriaceae bacterium]|nr:MAG: hypothetical protein KatS3mg032_1962 [Cyclobacteriaceae bacterium]
MNDFLKQVHWNNEIKDYLISLGIMLAGMGLLRLFRKTLLRILKRWAERTHTTLDDYLIMGLERFGIPILNFTIVYWALQYLQLSQQAQRWLRLAPRWLLLFSPYAFCFPLSGNCWNRMC